MKILYEDNHLIAVYKPHGTLVQADKTGDATILDEVKYYLKEKYNKPGNVFVAPIHRLDRPAAGILLLAKTSKGAERLTKQWREHGVQKIYQALVEGEVMPRCGTLINYLQKNTDENVVAVFDEPAEGALRAELDYEVVNNNPNKHGLGFESTNTQILRIVLKTGRSHQIRAQLAHIGHPIVGDIKYGSKTPFANGRGIALCATDLTFQTATTGETVALSIPETDWFI